MNEVRVFTDYELRTDSFDVSAANSADVTLDFVPLPDEGKRYTYRDRRYIFPGIAYTEEYYNPDYSTAIPQTPTDYRRTLYWNPNVKLDKNGTFTTSFYNNCRETRVKVSLSGLDAEGQTYDYLLNNNSQQTELYINIYDSHNQNILSPDGIPCRGAYAAFLCGR